MKTAQGSGMTNKYNFDQMIERRGTDSFKWQIFPKDVLPLWVADMDFISPPSVLQALHERVDHGIYGYAMPQQDLREVLVERMDRLYGWKIQGESIVYLPGIVSGLNQYCHAFMHLKSGVIVQTPVYPPFLSAPRNAGMQLLDAALIRTGSGRYEIDFNCLEDQMMSGARLFMLCNPHNPVGRVFTRKELEQIADLCIRHDVILCSDEIHCDLVYPGHTHLPISSLSPEIEQRTITFMAPSKTYNVAGLDCAIAIIPDEDLRKQFDCGNQGLVPHVNIMGLTAALAAYRDGADWLAELIEYLNGNRKYLSDYIRENLPELDVFPAEGTYLAWIDCRKVNLPDVPSQYFLEECKVALNSGADFGEAGKGFVRLNYGCPRSTLEDALERMTEGIVKFR